MKTKLMISLVTLLLAGCANMTKGQIGDLLIKAAAYRLATSPGYNYQQGLQQSQQWMQQSQDNYTRLLINQRLFQMNQYRYY